MGTETHTALPLDTSTFPIIRIKANAEYGGEEVHLLFNEIEEFIKSEKQPFVLIYQTGGFLISADTRVVIAERAQSLYSSFPQWFLGSAIVVQSIISRMMARGALLLVRHKHKVKLVENLDAAKTTAQKWLDEALQPN